MYQKRKQMLKSKGTGGKNLEDPQKKLLETDDIDRKKILTNRIEETEKNQEDDNTDKATQQEAEKREFFADIH